MNKKHPLREWWDAQLEVQPNLPWLIVSGIVSVGILFAIVANNVKQ